jgi:hypothetical protein
VRWFVRLLPLLSLPCCFRMLACVAFAAAAAAPAEQRLRELILFLDDAQQNGRSLFHAGRQARTDLVCVFMSPHEVPPTASAIRKKLESLLDKFQRGELTPAPPELPTGAYVRACACE